MIRQCVMVLFASVGILSSIGSTAFGQQKIDEMSLERWKVLRETERHQLNLAEKYYRERQYKVALGEYENTLAAVYSLSDLIDITTLEEDIEGRVALWRKLTYDIKRTPGDANNLCIQASQQLATHYFSTGNAADGVAAVESTSKDKILPYYVWYFCRGPIGQLTAEPKSKEKGEKTADGCVAAIRDRIPTDLSKPDDKNAARECWYHIADIQAYSRREDKVVETYQLILKQFGQEDSTLQRFAGWYKSLPRYVRALGALPNRSSPRSVRRQRSRDQGVSNRLQEVSQGRSRGASARALADALQNQCHARRRGGRVRLLIRMFPSAQSRRRHHQ